MPTEILNTPIKNIQIKRRASTPIMPRAPSFLITLSPASSNTVPPSADQLARRASAPDVYRSPAVTRKRGLAMSSPTLSQLLIFQSPKVHGLFCRDLSVDIHEKKSATNVMP